ncbi:MAG TPA: cytochrome c peroxidase [Gammaproteobacteria bacterium]|nr:cytochrome c peroxidase [Gammaproteobacteria bacterium]
MQHRAPFSPKLSLAVTAGVILAATLANAVCREPPANHLRDSHGALDMQAQMVIVNKLLAKRDFTQPPLPIDPLTWNKVVVPAGNRMTPQRVELGSKLYFETRLSKDGSVSCATCHDVTRGFTDQRTTSEGIGGALGQRNAPTTMNAFLMDPQFLDGRAPSLEEQAKLVIINPIEMGMPNKQATIDAIQGDPEYQRMFKAAYGSRPNYEDLAKAIAAFERTLVFLNSPYDDFVAGDTNAISGKAHYGLLLFYGARCISCHQLDSENPLGTDNDFHNIGISARHQNFKALAQEALDKLDKGDGLHGTDKLAIQTRFSELGRFLVTNDPSDIGAFKTSQLRNIGLTGPYMHDGSMKTLWDVMDHYNKGGEPHPYLDAGMVPLGLSEDEIDALVAFMFTLTDKRFIDQNRQMMEQQRKLAAKERPFRNTDMP